MSLHCFIERKSGATVAEKLFAQHVAAAVEIAFECIQKKFAGHDLSSQSPRLKMKRRVDGLHAAAEPVAARRVKD
jgi:hypothetical protein